MISVQKLNDFKGHVAAIHTVIEDAQGNLFSAGVDKHIIKWDKTSPDKAFVFAKTQEAIYSLYYHPISNLLFVGTSLGKVHVIDVDSKKEIKLYHHHQKQVFKLSEYNGLLYTLGGEGKMGIINLNTLQTQKIIQFSNDKLRSIDFKENRMALACGDSSIKIIDTETHKMQFEFKAHEKSCNVVKFHPTNNLLLSGGWDAHLNIWNESFELIKSIPAHNFAVYSIEFSPNNTLFATGSRDKSIKVWASDNIGLPTSITFEKNMAHNYSVNSLLWSKENDVLYSASDDKKIMAWNIHKV
jgi:WD repeat-containing protein 61